MPESSDSSVAATDKDRVLQLKSPFGDDVVATHVSGAERLSQLFHFDLSLQSAKGDLSADKILGSPVTILFHPPASDKPRVFHGYVTEFAQVGYGLRMHEYQATVRPWFWFLSRSADCRVVRGPDGRRHLPHGREGAWILRLPVQPVGRTR